MREADRDTAERPTPSSVKVQPDLYRGQRVGKYEIVSLLTMGGMAELFVAFTAGPGGFRKYVVLKRILPDVKSNDQFVKMFLDEARITAAFNHPNIGQVYDLGEEEDGLFLAMEFIAGQNLNQITGACWRRKVTMPAGFSVMVARDVCHALQYAHTFADPTGRPFPIIHRDVAQKNVMVTYDGQTKLLDFGIAKARVKLGRTSIGMVKGTTGYMSPEQVRGDPIDGRSDLFSAGVMLHEMLLGQRLFGAETEGEEMQKILSAPIPIPKEVVPELPDALSGAVMRALARNRDDRFATARDMAKALEQATGKLLFEREQAATFLRELFADRLRATQALLESAGGQWNQSEMNEALKLLSEDAGASFPPASTPVVPHLRPAPPPSTPAEKAPTERDVDLAQLAAKVEAAARPPSSVRVSPAFMFTVLVGMALAIYGVYRFIGTPGGTEPPARVDPPPPVLGPVPMIKQWTEHKPNGDAPPQGATTPSPPVPGVPTKPESLAHAPAKALGTLTLITVPDCKVFLGNKLLGKTPLFRSSMPVGTHLLRLLGPDGKFRLFSAPIRAGENAHFRFALADLPSER